MLLSSSSLYQARKHVHASTMLFFRRLRRSVISNLADENTRSHSADINGIDNRSNAILDRWRNSCWRAPHHSNGLSHGWTRCLQYSLYLSFVTWGASSKKSGGFSHSSNSEDSRCWSILKITLGNCVNIIIIIIASINRIDVRMIMFLPEFLDVGFCRR